MGNFYKIQITLLTLLLVSACGGGGGGGGGSDYTAPAPAPQNTAPVINNSTSSYSVKENQTSGFSVNASDAEGDTLTYTISGTDSSSLSISTSGVVTFKSAPDYDIAGDSDEDNVYALSVSVSDGTLSASKDFTITVTNDESDDVVSVSFDGVVVRSGYVQSANVCVEATAGDACSGSNSTTTSSTDGSFTLTQDFTGSLVSSEGFDVNTNQAFLETNVMYLTNPSTDGTNVISPLSTIVHLNDNVASSLLKTRLAIDSNFSLESTDPFSNLANQSSNKVAKINTQLVVLEHALLAIEPDGENTTTENKTTYKIGQAIANRTSIETSLGDTTFIQGLLTNWDFKSFTLSNSILENLSATISSYLQKIYADENSYSHSYFADVASKELNPLLVKVINETATESELNSAIFNTLEFIDQADSASFTYTDNESDLSTTTYSVSNVGSDYYTVDSVNADSTELVIFAKVGDKIVFDPSSSSVFVSHPFELSTTQNDTSGVNNIGANEGWDSSTSTLTVNASTPLILYPHCGVHAGMYSKGKIEIVESFDSTKIDITNNTTNLQVKGTVSKGPFKGASGFTHKVALRQANVGENFHTHEFNEYPGLTFYMTADQGYHGASTKTSDEVFKPKSHFAQAASDVDGGYGY